MNGIFSGKSKRDFYITRNRLSEKIDNGLILNKIVYIFGQIGLGKTVAVMDYVREYSKNVDFYELKNEHNNENELLLLIYKFLSKGKLNVSHNINDNNIDPKVIIKNLAKNFKEEKTQRIIILDNLNLITNNNINEMISIFIKNCPKNYRFILISEKRVPTSFSYFLANREIYIINGDDLRFSKDEIKELYIKEKVILTNNELNRIYSSTRGWPVLLNTLLTEFKLNNTIDIEEILSNNEYIEDFLDSALWSKWNYRTRKFFMIISLFKEINLEQAIEITSNEEAKFLLDDFAVKKDNLNYSLNPIFLNFIKSKSKEMNNYEVKKLYIKSAKWFEKNQRYLEAAQSYYNAEDTENEIINLEKFCTNRLVFTKFSFVESYIRELPKEILNNNVTLCSVMAIIEIVYFRPEKAKKWYMRLLEIRENIINKNNNILEENKRKVISNIYNSKLECNNKIKLPDFNAKEAIECRDKLREVDEKIAFLYLSMPQVSEEEIFANFYKKYIYGFRHGLRFEKLSLTANFPSMLRGLRDSSKAWNNYEKLPTNMNEIIEEGYGEYGVGVAGIVKAEVDYEKNNINKALARLSKEIIRCSNGGHIDTIFVAYIIMQKILCVNGNAREANTYLNRMKALIEENDAYYLMKNLNCYYVKLDLLNGKTKKSREWFSNYLNERNKKFNSLDMFEYFIKARIYILNKEYVMANAFLQMLYELNKDYNNETNIIECCILQAISLYRAKDEILAFEKIEEAIRRAEPLSYIRIFADEGEPCYEVLNKYFKSNRLNNMFNDEYLKKVLTETRKFAELYPKYLKEENEEVKIQLTKSETRVIKLIYKGMSNIEISEYLNIKIDTVKFHVKNIYSKLNVKNRMQAVQVANECGIL